MNAPTVLSQMRAAVDARRASPETRLNVAEVAQLERVIRDGIDRLAREHQHKATTNQIAVLLSVLDFPCEVVGQRLEVALDDIDEAINLGARLAQHAPRAMNSIMDGAKWDAAKRVLWWRVEWEDDAA